MQCTYAMRVDFGEPVLFGRDFLQICYIFSATKSHVFFELILSNPVVVSTCFLEVNLNNGMREYVVWHA
jgi:hypothetical protein